MLDESASPATLPAGVGPGQRRHLRLGRQRCHKSPPLSRAAAILRQSSTNWNATHPLAFTACAETSAHTATRASTSQAFGLGIHVVVTRWSGRGDRGG